MARARSALLALRKLFGDSPRPICLVDGERCIQYVNKSLENWCGLNSEALVGQRCVYHGEGDNDHLNQIVATLAPPPECFLGQQFERVLTLHHNGSDHIRRATFLPLNASGEPGAVLVVVDATECSPQEINDLISLTDESANLHLSLMQLRQQLGPLYQVHQLIGDHPAIQRAREQIQAAAVSRARVVVLGPPGSGREQVARTIYYMQSPGNAGALVPLSCSLLDAELLQTTISAFIHTKPEIEVTGPASLLLLDVDDLDADAQRSLMAVLNIIELQAHSLATSSRSLTEMADRGLFRADLANHLSTMVIELPPLAHRKEDIPLLAQKLLEHCNSQSTTQLSGWTDAALDHLMTHDWPGNIDELADVVRQSCRHATGTRVDVSDLPSRLSEIQKAAAHPSRAPESIDLSELLERIERELIERAMRQAKGNRARAARLLGISRARLLRRMSQLDMPAKDVTGGD
jgi:PAS domain S-box-containing protein